MKTKTTLTIVSLLLAAAASCKKSDAPTATTTPEATPVENAAPEKKPPAPPAPEKPKTQKEPATAQTEVPAMPGHWKMLNDIVVPRARVVKIAANLGGEIAALRNTIYDVGGKRVQLNIIDAADDASADKIMARLKRMKAEKALLRRGQRIFEFVGKNDVLAEIVKARDMLAGGSESSRQ